MRKILRKTNRPKELDITNRILVEPEDYDLMPDLCFDPTPFIVAGIGAAGTAGSAAINAGSKWGSRTYMRVAKEMANYNTALNEAQYEKYQSPSALMRQYKEAGLNPNLVYQAAAGAASGGVPAGQVSTNPNDYAGDRTRYGDALKEMTAGLVNAFQDSMQKSANYTNTQAVTDNILTQSELNKAREEGQRIQNQYTGEMMKHQLEGLVTDNAQKALDLSLDRMFKAQERVRELQVKRSRIENSDMDTKVKAKTIASIDSQIGVNEKIVDYYDASAYHLRESVRIGYGNLGVAWANSGINQQNANTNFYNAETTRQRLGFEQYKFGQDYGLRKDMFEFDKRHRAIGTALQFGLPNGSLTSAQPWNALIRGKDIVKSIYGAYGYNPNSKK